MRILFCGLPAYGHVYPLLPLAIACRDAGHEVEFATGDDFELRLRRVGFPTHPVGMSIEQAQRMTLESDPALADLPQDEKWRFGAVMFGSVIARETRRALVPVIERTAPDLIVYEETDLGPALAAQVTGTPAVSHALGCQPPDRYRIACTERLRAMVARRVAADRLGRSVRRQPAARHLATESARPERRAAGRADRNAVRRLGGTDGRDSRMDHAARARDRSRT